MTPPLYEEQREPWSPARQTRAKCSRCAGRCTVRLEPNAWGQWDDFWEAKPGLRGPCPRCISSPGLEPTERR